MSEMKLGGAAEMVMRECVTLDAVDEYGVKMLFFDTGQNQYGE
jgi:hypothetical protein